MTQTEQLLAEIDRYEDYLHGFEGSSRDDCIGIAEHFAEFGARIMKEQMMKDAIEGKVTGIGPLINGRVLDPQKQTRRLSATYSFKDTPYCEMGDKVKVIILPSDEK